MKKTRLDTLLVDKGLFDSQEQACRAILAGQVSAADCLLDKPGTLVDPLLEISVAASPAYVSRGADKLIKALDAFGINPIGRVVLDAGASTGGFTDVLLSRGAQTVIAVDVGYGQLAWKLRQDPRVAVFERTNIRAVKAADLPAVPDLVVADLSFISLAKVAPNLISLSAPAADFVFLIKPQFEAAKGTVGKGGIIREAQSHIDILTDVAFALEKAGLRLTGLAYSPITGADGNIEFLAHLRKELEIINKRSEIKNRDLELLIKRIVIDAHKALERNIK